MRIVDAHTHVMFFSSCISSYRASPEHLLEELNSAGIEAGVVSAVDSLITTDLTVQKRCNDLLSKMQKDYPGRLYGMGSVNPRLGEEAISELKRCKDELGLKGIKLHPWLQAFSVMDKKAQTFFKEAENLKMPIIFHDGTPPYSTPFQIGYIAGMCPKLSIILGHSGVKDLWQDALEVASKNKNVYLCLCGPPYLAVKKMVKEIESERIMFGSDAGFGAPENIKYHMDKIMELKIDRDSLTNIMGKSILKLLTYIVVPAPPRIALSNPKKYE
jgi:predicted TIM-barrel fold metal-dependent hydrolase